jgi:hypothetical protein
MNTSKIFPAVLALLVCMAAPFSLRAAEKPLSEKEKIEALITHIENLQDATFVRNGSSYNAKTAGRFLRGKWDSKDKEIHTATDFIEKAASISSTSGKPYIIRFKDGHEANCGDFLREELKKLETTQQEKPKDPIISLNSVGGGSILETPSYKIRIQGCNEYEVTCDSVTYIGISKQSSKSITLTGTTVHTIGADGVTPSHFLAYMFKNGSTTYFVGDDGKLLVTTASNVLVEEQGVWE